MIASEQIDLGLKLHKELDLQTILPFKRLLSLHPNWFISDLSQQGEDFTVKIKDYDTENTSLLTGNIKFNSEKKEILAISLTGAVNINIRFFNIDNLLSVQTFSPEKIETTDPALLWIRAIKEYIRLYIKTTPVTIFFRILMNRMILTMNPSQRKICMMLAKITFVEIIVIIFIVVAYKIFVL